MHLPNYKSIELTYVVPVYVENERSQPLEKLISKYEQYSKGILEKIHFVFVDDCSPINIRINSQKLNFTLARITDDIKWNQGGARNLGVLLAKSAKLVLTDLDHTFPEATLKHLLKRPTPKGIFTFKRIKDGNTIHPHPNTFFCTKSIFYKSLGVDEEFCGNYGYEDIYFMELQKRLKTKIKTISRFPVTVREHKELSAESHHNLVRNTEINENLLAEKLKYLNTKEPFLGHSRLSLNFNWTIVAHTSLDLAPF